MIFFRIEKKKKKKKKEKQQECNVDFSDLHIINICNESEQQRQREREREKEVWSIKKNKYWLTDQSIYMYNDIHRGFCHMYMIEESWKWNVIFKKIYFSWSNWLKILLLLFFLLLIWIANRFVRFFFFCFVFVLFFPPIEWMDIFGEGERERMYVKHQLLSAFSRCVVSNERNPSCRCKE